MRVQAHSRGLMARNKTQEKMKDKQMPVELQVHRRSLVPGGMTRQGSSRRMSVDGSNRRMSMDGSSPSRKRASLLPRSP